MGVIAIDIGGSSFKVAQVQDGAVLRRDRVPHTSHSGDLDRLATLVWGWIHDHVFESEGAIRAIGIAVPGLLDARRRSLATVYDKLDYLVGVDLVTWAEASFGLPAVLENDGRAAGWGEYIAGAGRGCDPLIVFSFGTGVGTSVIIHGKALIGRHGYGGILGGHQRIRLSGRTCSCGQRGCLESEASAWALPHVISDLSRQHSGEVAPAARFEEVLAAARHGDRLARAVQNHLLTCWAVGITNACNLIDPDRVVLTGGLMAGADHFLDTLRRNVSAHHWDPNVETEIVVADDVWGSSTAGIAHLAEQLRDRQG